MALSEEEWEGSQVQVGGRCDLQCLWGRKWSIFEEREQRRRGVMSS